MKNDNGHDWSSLGHKPLSSIGGSIFGLIGANHGIPDVATIFNSWSQQFNR
jgi:hypothetical protein